MSFVRLCRQGVNASGAFSGVLRKTWVGQSPSFMNACGTSTRNFSITRSISMVSGTNPFSQTSTFLLLGSSAWAALPKAVCDDGSNEDGADKVDEDTILHRAESVAKDMGFDQSFIQSCEDKISYLKSFDGKAPDLVKFFEGASVGEVSVAFGLGAMTGFTAKKISKGVALTVGSVYIIMQSLAYFGYVTVNFDAIERDALQLMDLDNNGKVDERDAKILLSHILRVLEPNAANSSGFATGFVMGMRKG